MREKLTYVGAGMGLVLFALFGLLPGSFLGGVMGLNIAGLLFGYPVTSEILPRVIVALSMLIGVMVSGLLFIVAGTTVGWLLGLAVDTLKGIKRPAVDKEKQTHKI